MIDHSKTVRDVYPEFFTTIPEFMETGETIFLYFHFLTKCDTFYREDKY